MVAIILILRTELFLTIKWLAYEKHYQSFHPKNILLLLLSNDEGESPEVPVNFKNWIMVAKLSTN